MTDKIISDLESLGAISGDESLPAENGVGTFSTSINSLKDYTINHQDLVNKLYSQNYVLNGDFRVSQTLTSFTAVTVPANNNDTYVFDYWNILSDGNDVADLSQETIEKPDGAYSSLKIDIETANKQMGIFQPMRARDAAAFINGVASMAFEAKKDVSNVNLGTLRAAIVSWDGAEDAITSDIVSAWAGGGSDPMLAANWTYENTPIDLVLTDNFQEFKIENVSINTPSTKNIGVFIWIDDTDCNIGDLAYISKIRLSPESIATPHKPRLFSEELLLLKEKYCSSKAIAGDAELDEFYILPQASGIQIQRQTIDYPVTMDDVPSVTVTKISGSASLGSLSENTRRGFRHTFTGSQYNVIEYIWEADSRL